jgi:toxin ParE1/3/4
MNSAPLRVDYAKEARTDIKEICLYFAQRVPEVRIRFRRAIAKTVHVLARSPNLGERYPCRNPRLKGMRRWQVDGFPNHVIFYRPVDDRLEILRVLHGARNYAATFNEE